ncbi:hypothetical protein [Neptuniibacter halophilus]|uniref:hypothetical protein n=1 Tax=Neptuniibacter halophilus TaxID=651666 RepID=UPI00257484DC|nr:hypothetical protein [Neptuniibacter halophilus]
MISGDLLLSLKDLIAQQTELEQALLHETHSIWMPGMNPDEDEKKGCFYAVNDYPEYLQQAIKAITGIEYQVGQQGNETKKQKGVLLVGPSSLAKALEINETKAVLAEHFKDLRTRLSKHTSLREVLNQQEHIRSLLRHAGIGRLCVKQATRKIPVVEKAPHRISWLEKQGNSVRRITIEQAAKMLDKLSSEQAHIDREILSKIPSSNNLAIVQKAQSPTLKATLFHPTIKDGVKTMDRRQVHAPVPILCATGNIMPVLNKGGTRTNTQRSDQTISPEVFLPSIRAHQYIA